MRHVEHINPRDDTAFVSLVDREAETSGGPEELQVRLRSTYPAAIVRVRGLAGEAVEVWYVYRDGTWTARGST